MRRQSMVVVLGAAASVGFLALAVRRLAVSDLLTVLSTVQFFPWIPLAVLSYLAGHVVRGQRCRLLVAPDASLPLYTAANVVVVGYAANNVFPARLGELVRAGMLTERTGIPVAQSLTITFIERLLDGLAILGLLLVCVAWADAPPPAWTIEIVRVAAVVFGAASVVLLLAVLAPGLTVAVASRAGSRLPAGWHDRLVRLATSITNGGACLRNARGLGRLGLYSILVWVLEGGMFLSVMRAFDLPADPSLSGIAMSVTNLGLLVPSSPGFIGPFHYFCSQALTAYGVGAAQAVAYAAVVHLTFYIPVTVWGALAMLWYGVEVGATAAMTRAARASRKTREIRGIVLHEMGPLAAPAPATRTPRFVHALVEALVVVPGAASRPEIVRDTADFVHQQLEALQPRLRLLLRVGLLGFRWITWLRFLRGYADLPLERRRAWTLAWAGARFALPARLMKPVQATALLAYYDHPGSAAGA